MRSDVTRARRVACLEALKHVKDGMVLGLGTGRTMALFVEELSRLIKEESISLTIIPSSYQSSLLALKLDLDVSSLDKHERIDLTVDSFDQVSEEGDAIKGGGAAMTREKVLCVASDEVVFIGDEEKLSSKLTIPVPLEILPLTYAYVSKEITRIGGRLFLRESEGKAGPIISDNGNLIADAEFGTIDDPRELDRKLLMIPAIIGTGLFVKMAKYIYVGYMDGSVRKIVI